MMERKIAATRGPEGGEEEGRKRETEKEKER